MEPLKEKKRLPVVTVLVETFGFSPAIATLLALFVAGLCILAVAWVIHSAPPRRIVLATGPDGSGFHRWGLAYQKALANEGITVEVLTTAGSLDNLERLLAPKSSVDLAFVSGGLATEDKLKGLISLGSVAYQPLMLFYRNATPIERLSELAGKNLAVGAPGSGTRALSTALLAANGVTGAPTTFSELEAGAAATALLEHRLDAVFLMGDSAPIQTLRSLMRAPDVQLFTFTQADAYVRRRDFLTKITLPQGSMDLGKNLPSRDIVLIGPTVELVAPKNLNPALSDLLLTVAKDVHGRQGLLQKRGEFPAPLEHEFKLSDDALRYYKNGKGFLFRTIGSFWVASLINRLLVAVLPLILVIIPAIRYLPVLYRFSIQLRLYRCYRPLLRLEREMFAPIDRERYQDLVQRLDEIETKVNRLKVPASFADRYYWLRSHVAFVRQRLGTVMPG